MTRRMWRWVAVAAGLFATACGSSSNSAAPAPTQCTPPATATVFWRQDVYPILAAQCVACHGDNQSSRPKLASVDPDVAYSAARSEVNLANPSQSNLVVLPTGNSGHPVEMDPAQAATVTKWIEECAQNNSSGTTVTP